MSQPPYYIRNNFAEIVRSQNFNNRNFHPSVRPTFPAQSNAFSFHGSSNNVTNRFPYSSSRPNMSSSFHDLSETNEILNGSNLFSPQSSDAARWNPNLSMQNHNAQVPVDPTFNNIQNVRQPFNNVQSHNSSMSVNHLSCFPPPSHSVNFLPTAIPSTHNLNPQQTQFFHPPPNSVLVNANKTPSKPVMPLSYSPSTLSYTDSQQIDSVKNKHNTSKYFFSPGTSDNNGSEPPPFANSSSVPELNKSSFISLTKIGQSVVPKENLSGNTDQFTGMAPFTNCPSSGPDHVQEVKLDTTLMRPPIFSVPTHLPPPNISYNVPFLHPPPHLNQNSSLKAVPLAETQENHCEKVSQLSEFLSRFSVESIKAKEKGQVVIPEFRSALLTGVTLIKQLQQCKLNLSSKLESDDDTWNAEIRNMLTLQNKMLEICSFVANSELLLSISKKLQTIKKRRELKKKTKLKKQSEKLKKEQHRKERNQEIDKWLDDISEKNLKQKRALEMKKEADNILLEVRKKIHEAKRTIERIKVLEKLRNVRQANAVKKGLHVHPEHNENFEKKISILKRTMERQLEDYEAEEKAMKVMLETEQEGQIAEENQWKIKKIKALQKKKQRHIIECLFGKSEDPEPTDPLYLFHQFQVSANVSIENLVNIRHQWDVYMSEDGEAIPQKWVVPAPPSDPNWEACVTTATSQAQKV